MKKIVMCFLIFSPFYFAIAQADCSKNSVSSEIDACAKIAKNSADAHLDESYKALIGRAKSQYEADTKLGSEFIVKLKESQRSWLKSRDTNCALEAFEIEVGQPAYLTAVNNYMAKMSLERSGYLDKTLPDL